jgi:hypothetical protein
MLIPGRVLLEKASLANCAVQVRVQEAAKSGY